MLSISLSGLKHRDGSIQDRSTQESLSTLQRRTISLVDNVRRLSHDLHPSILRHVGLAAALEDHCIEMEQRYDLHVNFAANGDVRHISRTCALSLFRIAQEALRNAAVHGNARRVGVAVSKSDEYIELRVADDGSGFDLETTDQNGRGLGLKSMEERAHLLGGHLQIVTRPHEGTVIRVLDPSRCGPRGARSGAQRAGTDRGTSVSAPLHEAGRGGNPQTPQAPQAPRHRTQGCERELHRTGFCSRQVNFL